MAKDGTLERFYNTFRGNPDFFVRHQAPFTEEKKKGKLSASWCGFAVYNRRNPPPEGKENGDLIPVTKELYREHLNGGDGLAITPLTNAENKRNVCFYAVIDIDAYGADFTWLVSRLYQAGFKFAAFLSKSGGLHIYFFFAEAEPGDRVIETLKKIVEVYGLGRLFVNEKNKSKVEIFPKQAVFVPGDKNANCLLLPFYNAANKGRQNMLTAEGKLTGITKALPVIAGMLTSVREINSVLGGLPYADAPYCVQMILLSGALGENDGRNNFLFSAAVYLKKKYKDDFKDVLQEMNGCLQEPLAQNDIDSIYRSVTTHGYDSYSCGKSPCAGYCDKKLCALREYGAGRQWNNRFTGADCWGDIYKVLVKDPYYLWEVRVKPEDKFKRVRFESEEEILNQSVAQRRCLRDLCWVPAPVKQSDWAALVNEHLEGLRSGDGRFCLEVPKETDTTETGELHGLFVYFLTHRQVQNGQPQMIGLGQVYHDRGVYYFTTRGITDFLRFERFSLGKINLREQLIAWGCSDGEITYKTAKGEEKVIECWKKPDDGELSEAGAFYEDIYDGVAETVRENRLNKKDREGDSDEGVKF
jgi:hypothetical protein